MRRTHVLERAQLVPRPRPQVWRFFSDPANLEAITPDFLRFRIAGRPPGAMVAGAIVEYRLSLFGISFGWRTGIEEVVPEERFVDVQLSGPYRRWRHLHRFEEVAGGTLVSDRVEYELPLGPLGAVARALFVARALDRIFDHRRRAVEQLLGPVTSPAAGP